MKAQDITPEMLVDLLVPSYVSLSPDGSRAVYSAAPIGQKRKHALSSLWLADTSKEHSARQITSGLYNDQTPQWRPNGDSVAFLSDRHKQGSSCAIFLQDMSVGEPVALTDVECEKEIETFAWSPDGRYIAYLSADEKSEEQKAKEKSRNDAIVHGTHWEYGRLRLLDVEARKVSVLVQRDMHVAGFGWSPDSKSIVYKLHADTIFDTPVDLVNGNGVRVEVVDVETGDSEHVLDFPGQLLSDLFGIGQAFVWCDDGVKFLAPMKPTSCASSWVVHNMDMEKKTYEHIAYGEKNDARTLKGGKDWVVSAVLEGLQDEIRLVDGETLYSAREELQAWDVVKKPDGDFAVVVVTSSASKPAEIYMVDAKTKKKSIQLSNHGETVANAKLGTSHVLECKSYDQKFQLQGLYITPSASTEKPRKPLPTAVFVHGGPYYRGTDSFSVPHFPWSPYVLACGKYGILIANYRGNSSQGNAHAAAVSGESGTLEHDDILALVDEGIEQGFIDPENVLIGGWSYGGLLSYTAAAHNGHTYAGEKKSWRYKGAIPGAGPTDQELQSMSSDFIHYSSEMCGSKAWTTDTFTETHGRKGSPVRHMKQGAENAPPCLILHCEKDDRVPLCQAWAFQRALKHYGVKHEMITYPREGHMVIERAHMIDMLMRVRSFCDQCFKS